MSYQNFAQLDAQNRDQLACTLAALILHDESSDVNSDSISKVLKAANVNVAPYWPMLLGKALEGKNVGDFLKVSGGSAPAQVQATSQGQAPAQAKDDKPAAPVEEEEEVDMDMGGLFD